MKFYLYVIQLFFLIPTTNAQSWEILFDDVFVSQSFNHFVFPGPNNSVRFSGTYDFIPDKEPIFSFDKNGNLIGQNIVNWQANWKLINVDNTGASYWVYYYKLRKLTEDNQIAWTYDSPANNGFVWEQAAPNGLTCLAYYGSLNRPTMDFVNSEGQLVNSVQFTDFCNSGYLPGYDNSLIYCEESLPVNEIHWVKKNQSGQIVWAKDWNPGIHFLSGSFPDGTTYFTSGNILTKLNAAGNVEWKRNGVSYFPESNGIDYQGIISREDGSVIVVISNYDLVTGQYTPHFINIDPLNGDIIWIKNIVTDLEYSFLIGPLMEMPDGGILACFGGTSIDPRVLIVRTDPNGNTITNQIAGKIYWDENYDCLPDASEKALKQVSVIAQSGTKKYSATSDGDGNFSMATTSGEYTLSIAQPGSYWNYCGFPNPVIMEASNDTVLLNIGAKATVLCPELFVSIGSPVFRRCFDNNYLTVQYQNLGTAAAINAYVSVTLDPKLLYLSSTASLLSQNGQTYNFDIGTVGIGESGFFTINFKVDCDATLGEILCVDSHIYPDTICIPTAGARVANRFCLPVVASYDPNDKTAFVNGKLETAKILPDADLEYVIRFQNTGNDTAFNIVIADTLFQRLNATSVVPGASSHPYFFELRDGNVLRFVFNNILLPDSNTNEAASHGFVKFYIRQTPGNPIGATISNTAAIFFDYNLPVITNESKLVISNAVRTNEPLTFLKVKTWPVPARERVILLLPDGASPIQSWKLIDLRGQVLRSGGSEPSNFSIHRNGLPAGVYWCQLMLENGRLAIGRIIFIP
ncbi:MAG: hypothetical protein Q7T20_10845 [Saprospiraceae bacterium]|nr:hypothetical protein [Saprospiraceae bacterium]